MPLVFALLICLSAACVWVMIRIGTLDVPVDRSSHSVPTPKGGGVGILAAFVVGMVLHWRGAGGWRADLPLVLAVCWLGAISYLDDVRNWPFAVKLLAQLGAAVAVMAAGTVALAVALPGGGQIGLGLAGVGLTLLWLVFVTNAVNFIDGLNGLASGCALVACGLAMMGGAHTTAAQAGALAAGLVGFLPFNYPRARIFMGDVGSQACGFALAAMAVAAAGNSTASLVLPLALLPILADAAFTLVRRLAAGARLTQAHRGHLYQVAQRSGVPAWAVSALYWVMTLWAGLCGLAAGRFGHGLGAAVGAVVLAVGPMLPWGVYVAGRARRVGVGRW